MYGFFFCCFNSPDTFRLDLVYALHSNHTGAGLIVFFVNRSERQPRRAPVIIKDGGGERVASGPPGKRPGVPGVNVNTRGGKSRRTLIDF